jgi:hypothetical protein
MRNLHALTDNNYVDDSINNTPVIMHMRLCTFILKISCIIKHRYLNFYNINSILKRSSYIHVERYTRYMAPDPTSDIFRRPCKPILLLPPPRFGSDLIVKFAETDLFYGTPVLRNEFASGLSLQKFQIQEERERIMTTIWSHLSWPDYHISVTSDPNRGGSQNPVYLFT